MKNEIRKLLTILLCITMVLGFAGCSGSGGDEDLTEEEETEDTSAAYQTEGVDVDLTKLSSTMVYSEVYNMMSNPEDYEGKVIRTIGMYDYAYDELTDTDYFFCINMDATGCCAQGMEFLLTDDYKYPDDYPREKDLITVTGTYETYEENGSTYCRLANATLGL